MHSGFAQRVDRFEGRQGNQYDDSELDRRQSGACNLTRAYDECRQHGAAHRKGFDDGEESTRPGCRISIRENPLLDIGNRAFQRSHAA